MARNRREDDEGGIDLETVADGVGVVSNFAGTPGHFIGAAASVVGENARVDKERQKISQAGINLDAASSRAAKAHREELENRPVDALKKGLAMTLGGALGAWLMAMVGSAILPIGGTWVGGILGSIVFGYGAAKIYDATGDRATQHSVGIIADCHCRGGMNEQEAATVLLTHLPAKLQEKYAAQLERFTGTANFAEAAQTPEGMKALSRIMRAINDNPYEKARLLSYSHLPGDPSDPDKPVEAQLAELANNGVDIRLLVQSPQAFTRAAERYYGQRAVQSNTSATAYNGDSIASPQLPFAAERNNGKTL